MNYSEEFKSEMAKELNSFLAKAKNHIIKDREIIEAKANFGEIFKRENNRIKFDRANLVFIKLQSLFDDEGNSINNCFSCSNYNDNSCEIYDKFTFETFLKEKDNPKRIDLKCKAFKHCCADEIKNISVTRNRINEMFKLSHCDYENSCEFCNNKNLCFKAYEEHKPLFSHCIFWEEYKERGDK